MGRPRMLAVLALLPSLSWAEGYSCAMDMATGFMYIDGIWREQTLKAEQKFIVRPSSSRDEWDHALQNPSNPIHLKWVVLPLGGTTGIAFCPENFDAEGGLLCASRIANFRLNRNTLRFLYTYLFGYWSSTPSDEASDTPFVAIGKCKLM